MEGILGERGLLSFLKPSAEKNLQAIVREDEKTGLCCFSLFYIIFQCFIMPVLYKQKVGKGISKD